MTNISTYKSEEENFCLGRNPGLPRSKSLRQLDGNDFDKVFAAHVYT